MKVVITGGGTGGHVFPGIAVAQALCRASSAVEILFIGSSGGFEARAVPQAGYAFAPVPARGLLGKRLLAVPLVMWTTLRGCLAAYRVMNEFDPDVVFATGGYVSGAVALAGRLLRKPLILHEQNSVPGLTNRLLSRVAQEVHLNLPVARRHFPRRRHLKLSGSPIRQGILEGDADRARREFGLSAGRRTVLILGGSQGARSINRAAVSAIRSMSGREDVQFVLQTGRRGFGWVQRRLRGRRRVVCVRPFIEQMGDAYQLADLVVARAGAMTLAEICACGKASILIPFPHATHNHQEKNARALSDVGAAEMIEDRQLRGDRLAMLIAKSIDTPQKLREMSHNALLLARPDAADRIARALLHYAAENGGEPAAEQREARTRMRRPASDRRGRPNDSRPRRRRPARGREVRRSK